jgi:DNA segregation ATPase FtsK/SpoIIIE, S-DNA-T family
MSGITISSMKKSLKELFSKLVVAKENLSRLKTSVPYDINTLNHKLQELINKHQSNAEDIIREVELHLPLAKEHGKILSSDWINKCRNLRQLLAEIDGLDNELNASPRLISLPWSDNNWNVSEKLSNSYKPIVGGDAPEMLRVGKIIEVGNLSFQENLELLEEIPAFVPIRRLSSQSKLKLPGHIVIFSNDSQSRQEALYALESIALRLISTFPIRKVRGAFIDPVGMGGTFPFKSLPDFIVGKQTYTRSEDVKEQLRKLTVHVEQVIQNYLSKYYQTIEEYNSEKSAIVEAYRYLCVADFPTNFDSNSWEDLKSLLVNGAKAGAYGIIHVDETLDRPRNFSYDIFRDSCTVIRPTDKSYKDKVIFNLIMPNGLECKIILDEPPQSEQFNAITSVIGEAAKNIQTDTVAFSDIHPQDLWTGDSRKELRASIGITGARNYIDFWMGNNEEGLVASSGLLAGKPGAGKSYTLHAIINSLAMKYSPDELEMYLLDFKEGVEFQIYINPEQSSRLSDTDDLSNDKALPHARVISVESDREFGLSVLQKVQKEIEERANKFKTPGVNVENLNQYREKTGYLMPRILVVIDEFQYMFQDRDKITDSLNLIFEDITRRGRAFGIHLLIASQSPSVPNMSSRIYSYIDLRMAMQMDRNTASSVLAEGNTDAVDLLDRPGKLIYNSDLGRKGGNNIGQVADVSQEARVNALLKIQEKVAREAYQRSNSLIIFNGNQPSKLSNNSQLLKLSSMDNWLDSSDINKQIVQEQDWFSQEFPSVFWLGESMKIGNHTQSIFRRRQRSNMLIVGTAEENISGMLAGILISLVHNYKPQEASFHIVDLFQSSEENDSAEMSINFLHAFQEFFPIKVGKRFAEIDKNVDKAESVLREAFDEFAVRTEKRKKDPDNLNLGNPYFLICSIGSLNRAQYLRPVAGRSREEPSEDVQKLINVINQGPELGIHTILWVDNTKTFQQMFGDSRSIWSPFDMRVGLAMPENDSRDLLGDGYAKNLPPMRAYFKDMMLTDGLEKFKPYAVPSLQEMNKYNHIFKTRLMRGKNV